MTGFHALRVKLSLMYREIAKFGAVGGAGVLVNIGVFNLVRHNTGLQTVRASVLATLVSIAFNYVGFRYFTYRDRDRAGRTKELGLFLFFSCIGMVIENGVLFVATYGFHWDSQLQSNVFKFLGIGVATLFRFWSYRTWVFRRLPARDAVEQAESFLTAGGTADGAADQAAGGVRRKPKKADANGVNLNG
ncbi:GtrA family protein [Streptomyces sp. NBC_01477]|uniref:GtrA family protein n=1 Tax=Streptomyces sp. NBC_01477 TaxID=2976015 RepID=UPI002E37BC5F|nr:GtrA family protein [Streptomyces sp. NBC_01477]